MAELTDQQLEWLKHRWKRYEEELKALIPVVKSDQRWYESKEYKALMAKLEHLPDGTEDVERDLRGAELKGANLSRANLRGTDLSGANLSLADLSGANLVNAVLFTANMISVRLRGATLNRACLRYADLHGAVMEQSGSFRG